jgi:hypothetical protein
MSIFSAYSSGLPKLAIGAGMAVALGTDSYTQGSTVTAAGGGMSVGFAGFVAVAQNTDGTAPQTDTTAVALANGGGTTTSYSNNLTIDFLVGPVQTSASISVAVASAHGFEALSVDLTPVHLSSCDTFSSVGSLAFPGLA